MNCSRFNGKKWGSNCSYLWILPFFLLFGGCSTVKSGNYSALPDVEWSRQFVVWLLSDIQPESKEKRQYFEQAIADVNRNIGRVDVAVIAGDILKSRSPREDFEWFLTTRDRAKVTTWYEIAGNHDVRSGDLFRFYFKYPQYYGVAYGNLILLLLSDQSAQSRTTIGIDAFNWWAEMVRENQNQIVITVTHGQLKESGLIGSFLRSRQIEDSSRFEKILQRERVAIWGSGHTHMAQELAGTISVQKELGGTCFVNVSSIGANSFYDSQSRFLIFTEGSDLVWIRSRNHTQQQFSPSLNYPIRLLRPFSMGDGKGTLILP